MGAVARTSAIAVLLALACCLVLASATPIRIIRDDHAAGVATDSAVAAVKAGQVCPTLVITDDAHPVAPTGYTFLLAPVLKPGANESTWFTIDVIHALSTATWHPRQVVCKYAACSSYACPTVTIISDGGFDEPSKPDGADWGVYMRINDTLICAPNDHDVNNCMFG